MLHWKQLADLSDDELCRLDVAAVNLACARGFPDEPAAAVVAECLDRLDHYARCAADYTERRLPEFRRKPEAYDGSEAVFRVVCMVRLLQGAYGVRYHSGRRDDETPFTTADTFVHGALVGEGGTCASLPVVYAAVGWRLGYPLRLVKAKCHLFVRWDEPGGGRFNVEINDTGASSPPDGHYLTGRYAVTERERRDGGLLRSLTPRQELADFLAQRGLRWLERGNFDRASEAFLRGSALDPACRWYTTCASHVLTRWSDEMGANELDFSPLELKAPAAPPA